MVYLNRIYTRSGDEGQTSLASGARVRKTHLRIIAGGAIDETNAAIGVALAHGVELPTLDWLKAVQHDLFDLGADVSVPLSEADESETALRIVSSRIDQLERWIDTATERLTPLTSFVLPGGSPAAAALHQARTVCRRAEIAALALHESEPINPFAIVYLNRLSDLLFCTARLANDEGRADILWEPGRGRSQS